MNKTMKICNKIKRFIEIHPYRVCPYCGNQKVERVSKYCNMCGKELNGGINDKKLTRQEQLIQSANAAPKKKIKNYRI